MGLFQKQGLLLVTLLLTSHPSLQTSCSDDGGSTPLRQSHDKDGVDCQVEVDAGSIMATTDAEYVCATLDWYPADRCSYGSCSWDHASILNLNLAHPLLEKALQALSPLRLRLGGTVQDEIVYDIGLSDPATQCLPLERDYVNITGYRGGCLSMERWIALNDLFAKAGVLVVFGLNALYNRPRLDSGEWGPWDSSNARDFIRFTLEQGIAVEGWELGDYQTLNRNLWSTLFRALQMRRLTPNSA